MTELAERPCLRPDLIGDAAVTREVVWGEEGDTHRT